MADKWSIPKRFLSLTLYDGRDEEKEQKILTWADTEANVTFNTSTSPYGMASEAVVRIIGLTRDKMVHLATAYRLWEQKQIYNRVQIEAGYDNNHGLIYDGTIVEATPNLSSANFEINLKCLNMYNKAYRDDKSLSYDGEVPVSQIITDIAGILGGVPIYTEAVSQMTTEYSLLNAKPVEHIRNLAKITGLDIWIDRNRVFAKKTHEPMIAVGLLKVNSSNIIGAPKPTSQGCDVSIRMNPLVVAGMPVDLESLRFPTLNSKDYFIGSFSHSGETKGKKWETHLRLLRKVVYEAG